MKKPAVFFEDINVFILPVFFYYLLRGYEISIFDFDYNLKRFNWLAKLINKGVVKRIFIRPNSKAHGDAIDATESIYENAAKTDMSTAISAIYKDSETDLIFKKEMVLDVFKAIYVNRYLHSLDEGSTLSVEKILISSVSRSHEKYLSEHSSCIWSPLQHICIPRWTLIFQRLAYRLNWIKYLTGSVVLILCTTLLSLLYKSCRFGKRVPIKKKFDFIFAIEQAFQTKFQGVRGFDFLLDGRGINKENTLFLIGRFAKREWINEQIAKAFYMLRFADLFRLGHCRSEHNTLFGFSNALSLIRVLLFKPDSRICFLRAFLKSLVVYIKYSVLIESFSFKAYIYTNNESASQIAINILLRKKNISSWCYLMFLVGGYPRSASERDFIDHRNVLWSFINPDHMIGMNNDVISYFRLHHQGVRNYHTVGSLYSEMVVINSRSMNREHFLRECFPGISVENTKVCAFFDTTFVAEEGAFASFDDGFAFYTDISKLLSSNEKILAIIKPSKGDSFYVSPNGQWSSLQKGEKIVGALNALKNHPRVYFAGDAGDIPSIMAVSDVVVTHCMSSTTAEALGARKKAIWYESGTKHKGLLYDHIPGLVTHGYQELEERLDFLLNNTSNDCYDDYLNHYIKGKVESHLDGKALTRFRDMLVNAA